MSVVFIAILPYQDPRREPHGSVGKFLPEFPRLFYEFLAPGIHIFNMVGLTFQDTANFAFERAVITNGTLFETAHNFIVQPPNIYSRHISPHI